jgi:hypothetical protein
MLDGMLDIVYSPTVRQSFIDKMLEPMASCLKNEVTISVGTKPTHHDGDPEVSGGEAH